MQLSSFIPLIPLIGSVAISAATPFDTTWYGAIRDQGGMPPSWVFAPVWTILYLMMGVAWSRTPSATTPFLIQLLLNYAWSPVFFGLKRPDIAMVLLVLLMLAAGWTTAVMWRADTIAGWLMVPYLCWLAYAATLNYKVTKRV